MTDQTTPEKVSLPPALQKTLLITHDEFVDEYKPLQNTINKNAPWDGCMLETYGKELGKAQTAGQDHVWTVLEADNGDLGVAAGFHRVNRMGYIVTKNPAKNPSTEVIDEPLDFFKRVKRDGQLKKINEIYDLSEAMKTGLEQARASWSRAKGPK